VLERAEESRGRLYVSCNAHGGHFCDRQAHDPRAVNILVTSFGTFKVVMSRYIPRNCMVLLQMDKWAMGQLRPTKVIEPAQTADAKNKVIIGEYTLIARNPNSSAKVVDFKES
jgi:hypothetical protein